MVEHGLAGIGGIQATGSATKGQMRPFMADCTKIMEKPAVCQSPPATGRQGGSKPVGPRCHDHIVQVQAADGVRPPGDGDLSPFG